MHEIRNVESLSFLLYTHLSLLSHCRFQTLQVEREKQCSQHLGKIYPCRATPQPTCVNHFAPDSQIDVTLFGCLLHKLDDKLVRFPDNRRPIHTDQFITRSQAAVSISSTQWYNVTDVNLMGRGREGGREKENSDK